MKRGLLVPVSALVLARAQSPRGQEPVPGNWGISFFYRQRRRAYAIGGYNLGK